MSQFQDPPKVRKKLVFRPAPALLKIAAILLILFSMAALLALRWVHEGILAETEKLTQEAAAIEYENADLQEQIDNVDSVQSVQGIAREELDLVDPDTVLIDPNS